MVLLESPICKFGEQMPNFELLNIDGIKYSSKKLCGKKGTLIMFICNHCPYVKAIINDLIKVVKELEKLDISSVAIMPNDFDKYPEDNFESMKEISKKKRFPFNYLLDKDQSTTKKFDAVCTPDFFGYNSLNQLQYRGRFAKMKNLKLVGDKIELFEAMKIISETQKGPKIQYPSSGCSIKWR